MLETAEETLAILSRCDAAGCRRARGRDGAFLLSSSPLAKMAFLGNWENDKDFLANMLLFPQLTMFAWDTVAISASRNR